MPLAGEAIANYTDAYVSVWGEAFTPGDGLA
jgi:hypothetical protein